MEILPAFGVQLTRLAGLRGLDAGALARRATVADAEIVSVLNGAEPDPALLRRLAPAMDLHRSDLFIIAGQQVPDDLAPLDAKAAGVIDSLAWSLTYLPRAVPELLQLVRSMPQQPRDPAAPPPTPPSQPAPNNAGNLVVRLLRNRNLNRSGSARYLYGVGRGSMLSAATIGVIERGGTALTPDLLVGFAAVLDISLPDLSALTGIDATGADRPVHPDAADAAALIWDARRLTVGQLREVDARAHAIRHERATELQPGLGCSCTRYP